MRVIAFVIFSALSFTSLWGGDFRVSNNAPNGPNSLRQAIEDVNFVLDSINTITFDAGLDTITLLTDLPLIENDVKFITPSVADSLLIDGTEGPYRIFGAQDVSISIQVSPSTTLTLSGLLDGNGVFQNSGSGGGTLNLNGINTYTGGTVASGGITINLSGTGSLPNNGALVVNIGSTLNISAITPVSQTIGALSGSEGGQIILGAKELIVNTTFSTIYSGFISGTGPFTKQGSGTLTLTGPNTYSGGTTVSGGVLQGNTTSLQGNIINNASVVFDQANTGTYAGVMSGTGSLIKEGPGTVIFTNDSSGFSSGTVAIDGGALIVNGILGGALTVFGNTAILGGDGTVVGNVTNNGSVQPGNSIGTLTINGNYTQGASGELVIEINEAGATDLLDVTGTATLNGILQVSSAPGVYLEGTTYTLLTAGSVTGQFGSTFSTRPLNYAINYFPTQAQLLILASSLILPARPNGNAGAVVDYLFCSSFDFANPDLDAVVEALLILPADQYASALNRLTPSQFGALALNELENNFSVANTFLETNQATCCYNFCESTNFWINPLGLVYSQKNRLQLGQEAIGFTNHTYGAAAGIDHVFSNDWTLGFGLGYSYSHLHWKDQAGKARVDSGYLGPYIKYDYGSFYFDFLVLGTGNFYDVDRRVVFPGVDRKAHSHPTTWDLSEVVLAGFRLEPFCYFFVQPEFLIDQLNIFQESFHESGAGSIDLSVKRKYASFLRSLINLKFVKEWAFCNMCLFPSVNVGWLRTTPLTGRHYTASFRKDTFCEPNFSVTSFSEVVDQVLVSGQLLFSSQGGFSLVLGYEGRFGNGSKVNEVDVALDWRF